MSRAYESIKYGAQHTPIGGACAECLSGGAGGALFDNLWVICYEVLYPVADAGWVIQDSHLVD